MKRSLILLMFGALITPMAHGATTFNLAATATNEVGVAVYRKLAAGEANLCLSPYSIEMALAMTFAGADGETRAEMARVLHLAEGNNDAASFAALQYSLQQIGATTAELIEQSKKNGGSGEPITFNIANRLFAQKGYAFRQAFLSLVKENYGGEFEAIDFVADPAAAAGRINNWVMDQTRGRIRNLVPENALNKLTRLVLANALYLKAPWAEPFSESTTQPEGFHVRGGAPVNVPTMRKTAQFGYAKGKGYTAVSLPYLGRDLQFLILLPDEIDGLRGVESRLGANVLADCARLRTQDVDLHLPRFKIEPPTVSLAETFQALGMKTAFDIPRGSANFDRMAPRKPNDYLYISNIFHKTFIAVDEKGTEAAAATAVVMMRATGMPVAKPTPIEVKVDRPFLYAIQHVPSGACLFLGRVTDPLNQK